MAVSLVFEGWDLLRLDGLSSRGFSEEDGILIIACEPDEPTVPLCFCDAPDVVKHGRRKVRFKDHPVQRQTVLLEVDRQRYRCRTCGSVLLQHLAVIDEDRRMTVRFRDQLAKDAISRTFKDAGELNGVPESMARRVFKDHAREVLKNYTYELPRVLGMDEKVISGTARFVVGDVEKRFLLDMTPSRRQENLKAYFHAMEDRHKVEVITQDMYWGYKALNELYFRKAMIVVDKFHVVRYANFAVETVRKKVQSGLLNEERVKMKKKIRLLSARPERLSDDGRRALRLLFKEHPIIETAVTCKEWFYDIYECENRAEAEKAFEAWIDLLPKEVEPAFMPIISFMRRRRWREFIFNYFEHPYTNAYVEAVNGLIDQINRHGRGYDLETLRAKALLRYGNVTPLIDEYAFDLASVPPEERDLLMETTIGHGVDLSTFERQIVGDAFW
jgi:transposase